MILSRYIIIEFLKPFAFTSILFSFLIQIGHLFDRLEVFIKNNVPVKIIFLYLVAMLPLWIIQLLPVCTLIAGVVTIGNMSKSGEILCVWSGGIPTRKILQPIFIIGLILTALTFVLGDTVMPVTTSYARNLYRTYVDKEGIRQTVWKDIIVLVQDSKRISAKTLDLNNNSMETVTVEEYGDHLNLRQTLTAERAEWSRADGWTFYNGVIRLFSKEGDEIIEEEQFMAAKLKLPESPQDIVPMQIMTEELSARELKAYINKINNLGIAALRERVQYHFKFAFPFTHILVLAIGIPVAFRTTQAGGGRGKKGFGQMMSLAVAIVIVFSYYALITMGEALGESRKITPWVGVWLANFIFAIAGIWLVSRIDK